MLGRWVIGPAAPPDARATLVAAARRIGILAGLALPIAMALVLWRQLAEFRDPFAPWAEDARILLAQTDWGRTWQWALAGSLAAPALFWATRFGERAPWAAASALTLLLCAFPSFTGHAAGMEELRNLAMGADFLHVIAAGSWVGGLLFVLVGERAVRRRAAGSGASGASSTPDTVLPALVARFSPVALGSAAVLVVTGAFASWLHVEAPGLLLSSTYGRLLLAKLALVAGVLALGAINWRRLSPALGSDAGNEALRRAATVELIVMNLVILVTGLLVRTSPLHDWAWTNIGH